MHTTSFLILAPVHGNTGIGTGKSGAPARTVCTASPLFYRCVRGIWASSALHVRRRRINHIFLCVDREFVGVLWQPTFPRCRKIPKSRSWRSRSQRFGACIAQIPQVVWRAMKNGDCQLPSSPSVWSPESLSMAIIQIDERQEGWEKILLLLWNFQLHSDV